jgi:hypothetical protein
MLTLGQFPREPITQKVLDRGSLPVLKKRTSTPLGAFPTEHVPQVVIRKGLGPVRTK